MKVLVVGGAGYIGGALTDLLQKTSYEVRVYDALLYEEEYRKPIGFVYGDVRDRDTLSPNLKWADVVIWMAALVGDGACALNPDVAVEINQHAVAWLSDHLERAGMGREIAPWCDALFTSGAKHILRPLHPLT